MPKKLTDLELLEVSLVDTPANQHAKVLLFKHDMDSLERLAAMIVKTEAQEFAELLATEEAEQAVFEMGAELFGKIRVLQDSLASILESDATDKGEMIQRSLAQFQDALNADLPSAADLTKALEAPTPDTSTEPTAKESTKMDLEAQVAELSEQVATLTKNLADADTEKAEAVAAAEKAGKIAGLSGDEKSHYDKLAGDDAEAFLVKSADDRAKDIAKAAEADEVLKYGGVEIRKSEVGEGQFQIMKQMAEDRAADKARLDKAIEVNQLVSFEKRAETEFAKLPGTTEEKAAALKALDELPEEVRGSVETMLKAGNKSMDSVFQVVGKDDAPEADSGEGMLDTLTKARVEKTGEPYAAAYDAVLKTPEGKAAYERYLTERRSA